jgi:hypothetical protein
MAIAEKNPLRNLKIYLNLKYNKKRSKSKVYTGTGTSDSNGKKAPRFNKPINQCQQIVADTLPKNICINLLTTKDVTGKIHQVCFCWGFLNLIQNNTGTGSTGNRIRSR